MKKEAAGSGYKLATTKPGDGVTKPMKGDTVSMHYTGKLTNGKVFDSSLKKGVPFKFQLGMEQVIKGWDEGVAKMTKGEKATLTCYPDYAYGDQEVGKGLIPANSTLIFEVELLDIIKKKT